MRRVVFLWAILVVVSSFVLWSFQGTAHAQSRIANRLLDPPQPFCFQAPDDFDCTGYDPGDPAQGCTSPYTVVPATYIVNPVTHKNEAYIEVRYSKACQSNWARITVLDTSNLQIDFKVIIHRSTDNRSFSDGSFPENFTQVYTLMVYAPGSTCVWAEGSFGTLSAHTQQVC